MRNNNIIWIGIFVLILCSISVNASLDTNISAAYKFDEGTGNTTIDSTGQHPALKFNSSSVGIAWLATGISNTGISLPSNAGAYIDNTSTNYNLSIGRNLSVNIWINTTKNGNADAAIWSFYIDSSNYIFLGIGEATIGRPALRAYGSCWVNLTESTVPVNDGKWHMITVVFNTSGRYLYVNGTVIDNFTHTPTGCSNTNLILGAITPNYASSGYEGDIDELMIWNQSLTQADITSLWNTGVGRFYPFTSNNPEITFNNPTPINNSPLYYYTNNTFTINATVIGAGNNTNITLYLYNSTNHLINIYTKTGVIEANYTFTNLNVGTYYYNATFVNDTTTNYTETRTVFIYNITADNIIVPSSNQEITRYLNITWTNGSITPIGTGIIISNHTIYLLNSTGGYNKTLGNTVMLNFTQEMYSLNLSIGQYYIRIGTRDNNGHEQNSTDRIFNLTKNAILNITAFRLLANSSVQNFSIEYRNLNNSETGTNSTTVYSLLLDTIIGHTYSINISSTQLATTTQNKTINDNSESLIFYDFGIIPCNANFSVVTLILKYYLEEYPTIEANTTTEITLTAWMNDPTININYTTTLSHAINHTLCLIDNTTNLYANTYIKYLSDGGFTHRYYYFTQPLNNVSHILNLYNWNTTTATSILGLTIRDSRTFNPTQDIVIKLQRYYTGEDVYRTVQMDKSSLFGTTYFNIRERDTDYKILFYDTDNNLLKESGNTRFSCTGGVCSVEVLVDLTTAPIEDISSTSSGLFNNASKIITTTWIDTSGDNKDIQYYVKKYMNNYSITICNTNVTTANTATFACNTTGYDGMVYEYITENGLITYGRWILLGSTSLRDIIGIGESNFWASGILITTILIAIWNPIASLIMLIAGTIFISYMGLVTIISFSAILLVTIILIILIGKKT